jgi:uncharacterized membrane protein (DUF106 family)
MNFLAQLITWINIPVNVLARFLLAPVTVLPGWLSNTIISAVTGVILLIIFKHTSDQKAISLVRNSIKANMLALKLFKDSMSVTLKSQGQIFKGAMLLLVYAAIPMLIMIIPVSLLLAQMSLWYQARPLLPGEDALVTMQLSTAADLSMPDVNLAQTAVADVTTGPVKVLSKHQIYWQIKARENGLHLLTFKLGQQTFEKELVVGDNFMRVSIQRPGRNWGNIMLHPLEKPFPPGSTVQSVSIDYPNRPSKTCGTDWWLAYFFIASMVFALIFKPFFKVKI